MWIYLDSEELLGGVGKALPRNISLEEGGPEDLEQCPELEDDVTDNDRRTKKRMRSTGGQSSTRTGGADGPEERSGNALAWLEQIGVAVNSLAGGGIKRECGTECIR